MDARTKALQMAQVDLGTLNTGGVIGRACHCMGPRNGEPLCPCAMRGVIVRDGRYVMPERDLGPVATEPRRESAFRPFDLSFMGKFR